MKKLWIFLILFVCLLSISSLNASNVVESKITSDYNEKSCISRM